MENRKWKNERLVQGILYRAGIPAAFRASNTTVTEFHYQGVIAASEFETYDAKKLYLCLSMNVSRLNAATSALTAGIEYRNEADVTSFYYTGVLLCYNVGAAAYLHRSFHLENFYFSRLIRTEYNYMLFTGYKLTLP